MGRERGNKVILTYKLKHNRDFSDELVKAKQIELETAVSMYSSERDDLKNQQQSVIEIYQKNI